VKLRSEYYAKMDSEDRYWLVASYGVVSTGISMNDVSTLVLVDVGKNFPRVIQSIGRGLRLDGVENHLVVHDLYASMIKRYKGKNRTNMGLG